MNIRIRASTKLDLQFRLEFSIQGEMWFTFF